MADVDLCTRHAEAGLCGEAHKNALAITKISDSLRVKIFRGKNTAQIESMLETYSAQIKKAVSVKYGFKCTGLSASSDNNREGADLYCINPATGKKIIIEVKFGSHTDHQPGMKQFAMIFGSSVFTAALSNEVRKEWAKQVVAEYPDFSKQSLRSSTALNTAVLDFNLEMSKKNFTLTNSEQQFLEDYLLNNSGSNNKTGDYMRFEVDKSGTNMIEVKPFETGVGKWVVKKVELMDINDEKSRVNVFVHNDISKLEIKFVLNNKNNLHVSGTAIKIPSKYMVNTPSWNVWIRKK